MRRCPASRSTEIDRNQRHRPRADVTTDELFLADVDDHRPVAELARERARAFLERRRDKLRAQRQRGGA